METCRNVGFELWQARKAKGWTRADVSRLTKLRIGQLEALESNDFQALPPAAYLSKHLRDYARELSLDPADVVARYLGQFDVVGKREEEPAAAGPSVALPPRALIAPLRRVAVVAVLLFVVLFFLSPAMRLIDVVQSDFVAMTSTPESRTSFGGVRETSREIAVASRLAQ
jgi:cytoskeleton protein RodZ